LPVEEWIEEAIAGMRRITVDAADDEV